MKRFISLFMSLVLVICTFSFSVYSADGDYWIYNSLKFDYPLTSRFFTENIRDSYDWNFWLDAYYDAVGSNLKLEYMSSLWCRTFYIGDTEEWCEPYLNRFETLLANAKEISIDPSSGDISKKYEHRVANYSWDGNTLTVQCKADYNLTYSCYSDEYMPYPYVEVSGNVNAFVYLAFTSKSSGELVYMGKLPKYIAPQYEFASEGYYLAVPEGLKGIYNTKKTISSFESTIHTFNIEMPDFYDAQEYDVTLCFDLYRDDSFFTIYNYDDYIVRNFYNPTVLTRDDIPEPPAPEVVRGDADGDDVLNLADVTATMKYLAEWKDVVIDEAAADTDGNGSVNLTDVSFMLQLIAGWNV